MPGDGSPEGSRRDDVSLLPEAGLPAQRARRKPLRARMRDRLRELSEFYSQGRPWRRWGIYTHISAFREAFGIDAYLYHKLVRDMMLLSVYLMAAGAISAAVYAFLDMVPPDVQADSGLFPFFQSYPHAVLATVFQVVAVLGHVLFRRGVRAARGAVTEDESWSNRGTADYTLVLTGIPCHVADADVRAFLEGVAAELVSPAARRSVARGGRAQAPPKAIARYVRILRPGMLGYTQRRAATRREYYTKLLEDPESILNPPRSCFRRFSDIFRLTPLLQRVGAYRDSAYYDSQLAKLNRKMGLRQGGAQKHTDTAFVTFEEARVCLFVLWRLRGVSVQEARRIESWGTGGDRPGAVGGSGRAGETIEQSTEPCCGADRFVSPTQACGLCTWRAPKLLGKHRLSASRAPHPRDVIWRNLHSTAFRRFLGSCASFCVALLITGLLAVCVLALRQLRREMSQGAGSLFEEYGIYVGMYVVILLFDQGMRPILRWAVTFERQHTYTAQERSFFWKYFFYNLMNRLAPMYSRNFLQLISPSAEGQSQEEGAINFLDIIKYTKDWRYGKNTAGEDLIMLMVIQIIGYNLLDLLVFGGRIAFLLMTAASEADRRNALEGVPIRYANFYSNLMCSSIIVMAYSYAQPVIAPMFLLYLGVHDLVLRLILLRLSARPPRTAGSLAAETDWILWFGTLFSMACIAQGQIGHGSIWYLLAFLTVELAFELVFNPWVFRKLSSCLLCSTRILSGRRMQVDAISVGKARELPPFSTLQAEIYDPEAGLGLTRKEERRAEEILLEARSQGRAKTRSWRGSSRVSAEGLQRSSGRLSGAESDAGAAAGSGAASKRSSKRGGVEGATDAKDAKDAGELPQRPRSESLVIRRESVRRSRRAQVHSSGYTLSRQAIDEGLRQAEEEMANQALAAARAGMGGSAEDEAVTAEQRETIERMFAMINESSVDDAE